MEVSFKRRLVSFGVCLILMASILAPSIIKLQHALFDHFQEECTDQGTVHLHKVELDCDFHKHQILSHFYPPLIAYSFRLAVPAKEKMQSYYAFASEHSKLHFSLRAPPIA